MIPEHVKRMAMDAVEHRETTAFMRQYGYREASLSSTGSSPAKACERPSGPLTDEVKLLAMDAIAHRETTAQIRLVEHTGVVFAPATPSPASRHAAQRVSELHRSGAAIDAVQREVTQEGFAHFYE